LTEMKLTVVLSTLYNGRDTVWDVTDILLFYLLPHLLIPTLLLDKIVSGVHWNIVNYCLCKIGKGGYNIPSEKCKKPFKK